MTRINLFRIATVFLLFAPLFAHAEKKPPMKAFAAITRAGPNLDFIAKVPMNTVLVPSTAELYKNDVAYYLASAVAVVENDGDEFELKYKIYAGKVGEPLKKAYEETFKGKLENKQLIVNFPTTIKYMFEDSDEFGDYEFRLEVENLKTGERAEAKTPVKLAKWEKPEPIKDWKELNKAMAQYNSSFNPKIIYAIFTSPHMSYSDNKGNFAYAVYGFTKTAFTRNKFLLTELEKDFPKADKIQRKNTIQLFEMLGEGYRLKGLDKSEQGLRDSMWDVVTSIPKTDSIPDSGAALDILWGEFFASGECAPIEKIILCAINNSANCIKFSELICAGKNVKDEMSDIESFMGVTAISACWSLLSNYNTNSLAKKYISWSLSNMPKERMDAFNSALNATTKYLSHVRQENKE